MRLGVRLKQLACNGQGYIFLSPPKPGSEEYRCREEYHPEQRRGGETGGAVSMIGFMNMQMPRYVREG